jgi:hypothetical protein
VEEIDARIESSMQGRVSKFLHHIPLPDTATSWTIRVGGGERAAIHKGITMSDIDG